MRLTGNLNLPSWDLTTATLVSEGKRSTWIVSVSVSGVWCPLWWSVEKAFISTAQWLVSSDVHRLFEGLGRKEGHFSKRFGSKDGTFARVLAPKKAVYHVLTSQGGSLVCFADQAGTLARFFGSPEGTLAHVTSCTSLLGSIKYRDLLTHQPDHVEFK